MDTLVVPLPHTKAQGQESPLAGKFILGGLAEKDAVIVACYQFDDCDVLIRARQ
jgi:hypothetical protein